jgi:tetratricopeptide (TPR) repeat protein
LSVKPDDGQVKESLKRSYYEKIKVNYENENYEETQNLIKSLEEVAGKYSIDTGDISSYLTRIVNKIELLKKEQEKLLVAERLLGEGGELQNKGELEEAKGKYREALAISRELEQERAKSMREEIENLIEAIDSKELHDQVARLKDEAVKNAYNEEYENALEKLRKAAAMDPENKEIARLHERLNNIVNLVEKAKTIKEGDPQQAFLYYKQAVGDIFQDFKQKSSRFEKDMVLLIHKLQKLAENKLDSEDPCGSLRILDMILGVKEMVDIPYFINNELQEIYVKSSSLKEALDIKCAP